MPDGQVRPFSDTASGRGARPEIVGTTKLRHKFLRVRRKSSDSRHRVQRFECGTLRACTCPHFHCISCTFQAPCQQSHMLCGSNLCVFGAKSMPGKREGHARRVPWLTRLQYHFVSLLQNCFEGASVGAMHPSSKSSETCVFHLKHKQSSVRAAPYAS